MNENEEVINILLAQVAGRHLPDGILYFRSIKHSFVSSDAEGTLQAQTGLCVH